MTLDITKYRINVPTIEIFLGDKSPAERLQLVSNIAVSTICPIIAVCYFTGELFGFNPELIALIENLKVFYKVTEVIT